MSWLPSGRDWVAFFGSAGIPSEASKRYAASFVENYIRGDMLADLDKEGLRYMGIKPLGDIILILKHAKKVVDDRMRKEIMLRGSTTGYEKEKIQGPMTTSPKATSRGEEDSDSESEGSWQCEICQDISEMKADFLRHIENVRCDEVDETVVETLHWDVRIRYKKETVTMNMNEKADPDNPKPGPSRLQGPVQGSEGSKPENKGNTSSSRQVSIQKCIQSLVHACQCTDANCQAFQCKKVKSIVAHTKSCKRKTSGGCLVCKQLIALSCIHAKSCMELNLCRVPFCLNIKQKMGQQHLQQRLQEAVLIRKRMAEVNIDMQQEEVDDDDTCIICQDREKVTVVVPCGHCDFCLQCVLELYKKGDPEKEQTCPICREPIEQIIPFSFSKFLN